MEILCAAQRIREAQSRAGVMRVYKPGNQRRRLRPFRRLLLGCVAAKVLHNACDTLNNVIVAAVLPRHGLHRGTAAQQRSEESIGKRMFLTS
jgi:hypothetical protein